MANTPNRVIRVPDSEWRAAQKIAAERGDTMTEIARKAYRAYVRRHTPKDTPADG